MRALLTAFAESLDEILKDNLLALYLHGSCAAGDYRPGWSDIDILCLTRRAIPESAAQRLLMLRQELTALHAEPAFRTLEGGFLPLESFVAHRPGTVVYWGTSGQRLTDRYDFNAVSTLEWLDHGQLLAGEEIRYLVARPSAGQIRADVQSVLETVRTYARETDESLYSAGWLFDIARCLYTLRHGAILPKTEAGEWALREGLTHDEAVLRRALAIRKEPLRYREDAETLAWLAALGPSVQAFADVLEKELKAGESPGSQT